MSASASSTSLARVASRDSSMENKSNAVRSTSAPAACSTALACRTILASSVMRTEWASAQCVWFKRVTKDVFVESFTYLSVRDFFRFGLSCKSAQGLCSDAQIWHKMAVRFDLAHPAPPPALYHQLRIERDLAKKTRACLMPVWPLPHLEETNYIQFLQLVMANDADLIAYLPYFVKESLLECVEFLLQSEHMIIEWRINALSMYGNTCSPEVLKALLELGPGPLPDSNLCTYLTSAALDRNLPNLKVLLASERIQITMRGSAIELCLKLCNDRPHLFETVQTILDAGLIAEDACETAITLARDLGFSDIVKLLNSSSTLEMHLWHQMGLD